MPISEFTKIIRARGWTISEACKHWGIRDATYYDRCNNPKMHNQLRSMCKGLTNRMESVK